jgi:hypothetical protein
VQNPNEGCLTFFYQYQFVLAMAVKAQHQKAQASELIGLTQRIHSLALRACNVG